MKLDQEVSTEKIEVVSVTIDLRLTFMVPRDAGLDALTALMESSTSTARQAEYPYELTEVQYRGWNRPDHTQAELERARTESVKAESHAASLRQLVARLESKQ